MERAQGSLLTGLFGLRWVRLAAKGRSMCGGLMTIAEGGRRVTLSTRINDP
jgi:hypothetical protein